MTFGDVKFEISQEFRINMNNKNIGTIIPINEYEYFATTTDELVRFDQNGIITSYDYQFITVVYVKKLEMIIGVTYIGSELVLIDYNNPGRPLLSGIKLNLVSIFHMIFSDASNSVIIFGRGIKVFTLNVLNPHYRILKKPEDFSFTLRTSFANWYDTSILNTPVFDNDRELIFLPTNNGLTGYNLDGKQSTVVTKLPMLKNSLFAYYPDSRKVFTFDSSSGSILWDKYFNVVSRYNISNVISSLHFVNNENVFYLTPRGYMNILNLKTQKSFVLNTIDYSPTRIFMFNKFRIPTLIICNNSSVEFFTIKIPWKVWARHVLHTTSIERVPSFNSAARIIVFTENSFAKIYSPKTAHMLTSATPYQSSQIKMGFYDRGLIVYYSENQRIIEQLLDNDKRDQIFMLLKNGILTSFSTGSSPCDQIMSNKMKFDFIIRAKYKGNWCYYFATKDCDLNIADYKTIRLIRRYIYGSSRTLIDIKYLPSVDQILMICKDSLVLIETNDCKIISELAMNQPTLVAINRDIAYLGYQTGAIFCVTFRENKLDLLNSDVGKKYHDDAVTGFSFSETFWVTSSLDQKVKIWNYDFMNIATVHLPLPILNCCVLNGRRDIIVATYTEIMILKGNLFFREVDEEVPEIDNFDKLEDNLAEYCLIPGNFDDDEKNNNTTSLLESVRSQKNSPTLNTRQNAPNNYNWDNFDMSLLEEKSPTVKVKENDDQKAEENNQEQQQSSSKKSKKKKYQTLSTMSSNLPKTEENDDKKSNLSDNERSAILAEMSSIEDTTSKQQNINKKEENLQNQKSDKEYSETYEYSEEENQPKKPPPKAKPKKKQNSENLQNSQNFDVKEPEISDDKIDFDDDEDNELNNIPKVKRAPRKGPQAPSSRPKMKTDESKTPRRTKKHKNNDQIPQQQNKDQNNQTETDLTLDLSDESENSSDFDDKNSKIQSKNKSEKSNKNDNKSKSDKTRKSDNLDKSDKNSEKTKSPKNSKKNKSKKKKTKAQVNDRLLEPKQIPEEPSFETKTIKYHKSVSSLELFKEPEIPVKDVNPHRAQTPPLVIKLHPNEKNLSSSVVLDRTNVIEKFVSGNTEMIDLLEDATRSFIPKDENERKIYQENVKKLHEVIKQNEDFFEMTKQQKSFKKNKKEKIFSKKVTPLKSPKSETSPKHQTRAKENVSNTKNPKILQVPKNEKIISEKGIKRSKSVDIATVAKKKSPVMKPNPVINHSKSVTSIPKLRNPRVRYVKTTQRMRIETRYQRKNDPLSLVTVLRTPSDKKERKVEYDTSLIEERRNQISREASQAAASIIKNMVAMTNKMEISARVVVHRPTNLSVFPLNDGVDLLELAVCEHLPDASPKPVNSIYTLSPRNKKKHVPIYMHHRSKSPVLAELEQDQKINSSIEANKYEVVQKIIKKPLLPRITVPVVNQSPFDHGK
ncbi:hypothetical protein TVAG_394740 [Trichomonas vaginalis G3]|uniref:Uncharacterized protein n=1 Tax=Trichomonas vaginalis (strain ATCC PRA-98 / G3) TaxID=412133 RepID=A2EDD8_TRIV3|nr:retinoblastoma-binding protein 6 family [Trichomonas vaginalis G3]EAY09302.1 hypothetical protein TVAG_394740 [Trichomonas vaginalis G3]KAI5510881.1 retinoblastoma-binding protein 6 family [Trichomonas vaginalis G3]|eukprot:XP_001321525.1 hypothetical protein [Trichomonas vaginalis G3]